MVSKLGLFEPELLYVFISATFLQVFKIFSLIKMEFMVIIKFLYFYDLAVREFKNKPINSHETGVWNESLLFSLSMWCYRITLWCMGGPFRSSSACW